VALDGVEDDLLRGDRPHGKLALKAPLKITRGARQLVAKTQAISTFATAAKTAAKEHLPTLGSEHKSTEPLAKGAAALDQNLKDLSPWFHGWVKEFQPVWYDVDGRKMGGGVKNFCFFLCEGNENKRLRHEANRLGWCEGELEVFSQKIDWQSLPAKRLYAHDEVKFQIRVRAGKIQALQIELIRRG